MQFSNLKISLSYHISYHIISYHIISYHIISYHIISYHIISYHIISYHIIYHIISYHISYHISYIISCHISYVISYHVSYNISYYIYHVIYHVSYIVYHISYHICYISHHLYHISYHSYHISYHIIFKRRHRTDVLLSQLTDSKLRTDGEAAATVDTVLRHATRTELQGDWWRRFILFETPQPYFVQTKGRAFSISAKLWQANYSTFYPTLVPRWEQLVAVGYEQQQFCCVSHKFLSWKESILERLMWPDQTNVRRADKVGGMMSSRRSQTEEDKEERRDS